MGITVSQSMTVEELNSKNRKNLIEKREIIRKELKQPIPQNVHPSSQKQNIAEGGVDNVFFQPRLIKIQERRREQSGGESSLLIKGPGNESKKNMEGFPKMVSQVLKEDYEEKKEVSQFVSRYLSRERVQGKSSQKQLPTTVSQKHYLPTTDQKLKEIEENSIQKNNADLSKVYNAFQNNPDNKRMSSISSPSLLLKNAPRAEFDSFDWFIPSEQDILGQNRQIEVLPSMTLVLSNKFNQNSNCMDECRDNQQFAKNRRQIMRDLLAGRRVSADNRLMACDWGAPSSKTCDLK